MVAPTEPLVRARWFDGRSSQARGVLVRFVPAPPGRRGPDLVLHPVAGGAAAAAQRIAFRDVAWPEAWSARRLQRTVLVDLGTQGSLEVDDAAAWHAARAAAGGRPSLVQRLQTHWHLLAVGVAVAAVALGVFYRYGTPWVAAALTHQVPLRWETDLAQRGLQALDTSLLKPSALPPARQAALREGFEALVRQVGPGLRRDPAYAPRWNLQFRAGLGANALALPGGTVVLTDGLVERAARAGLPDDALLGVLAHEMGHVLHRHTTRLLVEEGVMNVGLGLALGDVSSVVAMGSSLLTGLAYRRQHETEADCFSVAVMRQAGRSTAPMADLLLAIDGGAGASRPAGPAKPTGGGGAWTTLLSSHPDTAARAVRLRQAPAEGC